MKELLDFVKIALEHKGAIIEQDEDIINAVIPPEVAENIELQEFSSFTVKPDAQPDEIKLAYGSQALDKIMSLIENEGLTTHYLIPYLEMNKKITENDIQRHFNFVNAKFRSVNVIHGFIPYIIFNFRWTIISDMRRDGLYSCILNQLTGASLREIEESVSQRPVDNISKIDAYVFNGKPFNEIFKKACSDSQKGIEAETAEFKNSMMRRLKRDIRRVEEYYNTLIRELKRKRKGKKDIDELIKDLKNKEKIIKLELKAKRADLVKKYDTKVKVELVSAAQIFLPSAVADVKLLFKKHQPVYRVCWNPLTLSLEDLVCDGCGENTSHIYLCPNLHLLCEKCHGLCSQCGRRYCRVCHGESYPCDCNK